MSWKDKSFKEKKAFYKERQKFFDAVKLARLGENPVIKYKDRMYKLVYCDFVKSVPSFWDYLWYKKNGFIVIYSKKYKSHTIVEYMYSDKYGFRWFSENGKISRDLDKVLCFAEKETLV